MLNFVETTGMWYTTFLKNQNSETVEMPSSDTQCIREYYELKSQHRKKLRDLMHSPKKNV